MPCDVVWCVQYRLVLLLGDPQFVFEQHNVIKLLNGKHMFSAN
jgi:hypothetical protein